MVPSLKGLPLNFLGPQRGTWLCHHSGFQNFEGTPRIMKILYTSVIRHYLLLLLWDQVIHILAVRNWVQIRVPSRHFTLKIRVRVEMLSRKKLNYVVKKMKTKYILRDIRLPPRCMRASLFWDVTKHRLVVTDVSGQCIGPIFKGQAARLLGLTDLEYVTQHRLVVSHRRFRITYLPTSYSTAWLLKTGPIGFSKRR
jgi:hypothetical protein